MFVTKDYDQTVIGNFMKKKYLALSQLIGKPETTALNYSIADFKNLIAQIAAQPSAAGLKLYFASYCPTGVAAIDAIVNAGSRDLLTLIFLPLDQNQTDIEQYFIINPAGGVLNIPKAAASLMVTAYQKNKVPLLQEIIYDAGRPDFVETTSLWYELEKFNGPYGILGEMDCQGASGITAFLGSYDEAFTVNGAGGTPLKAGWQMTLIFEFAKTITYNGISYTYHFDLEDTGGFSGRQPAPTQQVTAQAIRPPQAPHKLGENTGNPCPPAVGCTSSLGIITV